MEITVAFRSAKDAAFAERKATMRRLLICRSLGLGGVPGGLACGSCHVALAFSISVWANFCLLAAGPAGAIGPGEPPEDADSRESVVLKDSTTYYGLIESVDDDWLTLIRIQSPRGQQMHLVIQPFDRSQVDSFKRLDAAPRRRWSSGSRSFATAPRSKPRTWTPSSWKRGRPKGSAIGTTPASGSPWTARPTSRAPAA